MAIQDNKVTKITENNEILRTSQTYTWTKYKVKVTLKKKVPKIGGMRIGDTWTKGNKKSYTVWLPKGAQTGKKLNIYMNTGLSKSNGQGPQIKKVIRAK